MAYSELIKNFRSIRDYMRQFYIFGFKSRDEYDAKSARSYDNERRRIASWLGEYLSFHQDSSGKNVFLSVDSRRIASNPIYKAFKAKSFTDKDITLHFYILDALADGTRYSVKDLTDLICSRYLSHFSSSVSIDESTLRRKLREYERLGLLRSEKGGKTLYYQLRDDSDIDLSSWQDAVSFFSEVAPLGVVGSYLSDLMGPRSPFVRFKHHYMVHALDSEILLQLLDSIREHRSVELHLFSRQRNRRHIRLLCPLKIYCSTQTGRQYILGYDYEQLGFAFERIDAIEEVIEGSPDPGYAHYLEELPAFTRHLWGVSIGRTGKLEHIEMSVHIEPGEDFVVDRLLRESRCGSVVRPDPSTARFTADVYDAAELLPWLRTFIGRIDSLTCSNTKVTDTFYRDLQEMKTLYGGGDDAVF